MTRTGRRNRVAPDGRLVASGERGLFWGNRGALLDAGGEPDRRPPTRAWITCVLEFKGWHRTQWQRGRLTELYFLDEPTALAAGHRPCALCRRDDYNRFRAAWEHAHDEEAKAPVMDARLSVDRRRTYRSELAGLPAGTMIRIEDACWLVTADLLRRWSFGGYTEAAPRPAPAEVVEVITPRCTVAVLAAGYRPVWHPSAG